MSSIMAQHKWKKKNILNKQCILKPGLVLIRNENKITIQEENKLLFEQIEIIYVHDVSKQESFFTKDTRMHKFE